MKLNALKAMTTIAMFASAASPTCQAADISPVLPSWNDGATKSAIVHFVEDVTNEKGPTFVPQSQRIATFDNDGTLWVEQPMYAQLFFAFHRVKVLVPQHPEWIKQEPFKSILADDLSGLIATGEAGIVALVTATHSGMTPDEFDKIARDWLATAENPRLKRKCTALVYQPMIELLAYLRENGFKTFIVSGGGVDFMRVFSEKSYNVALERVIGSSAKLKFEYLNGQPIIMRLPEIDCIDDKDGKPINIQKFIGNRPIAAFGNSDGDLQMLQWTAAGSGPHFCMYVHHTDAVREFAYDRTSKIGKLDQGLGAAAKNGWSVADMKNDWKVIFAPESNHAK